MRNAQFINDILRGAKESEQRTGQYLFNSLPEGAQEVITRTMSDPYQQDFDVYELTNWVNNHLIFDEDGAIINVFNGDTVLWDSTEPITTEMH